MGVTIQEDMYEAAQYMPESHRGPFISALVAYGMTGQLPDESEPWFPTFYVCKSRLDMSAKRSEDGKKAIAKRWGNREQESTSTGTKVGTSIGTYNEGEIGTYPEDEIDTNDRHLLATKNTEESRGEVGGVEKEVSRGESEGRSSAAAAKRKKRFAPPAPEEVHAFADEQGLAMDAADFCDYYESVGWTVGRNKPMKDWRAAARRWAKSNFNAQAPNTRGGDPDDYYDFSALDRRSDVGNSDADLPF